jgi:carboxyl-terminal processing protease
LLFIKGGYKVRVKKVGLWVSVCVIFLGLFLGIGLCSRGKSISQKEKLYESLDLFTDTISIIQSDFVDEVDSKDLIYGALKGMLSSLDPYSQFMDPDTYKEMKVTTEGEFGGIGIEISIRDNLLTVISPISGTPAYKAGLKANDRILKIDGESTKDITLMEAVKKLRGKPKTSVDLTILREGENRLLEFTIVRDIIKIESVKEAKLIEDKIGYIKLVEFQERTKDDFEKALKDLETQNIEGLILDLRNNPGGLLNVAVEIADFFLPDGKLIVSTKGKDPAQNFSFKSHKDPAHLDYPLVILINEGSASGSEIVAGALRDNKRAILLGSKTFGKGSVQTVIPLSDGSAIRLTTSKYYLPRGESIHEKGIMPDVQVDGKEYVIKKQTEDIFEEIEKSQIKEETEAKEEYDVQLARAIDLIKGIVAYRTMSASEPIQSR